MDENRYAILVGIDDYDTIPLNYCCSDAMAMKKMLVEKCMFNEKNIELIISNKENSQTELIGKYHQAINNINKNFCKDKDSVLFFFAGHGLQDGKDSSVKFHDESYKIVDIFKELSSLEPKMQSYIIDACHSGGKVLTRSCNFNADDYIESAGGTFILYACKQNQIAGEDSDLQHGLLTNMLLEAVDDETLYDKDGFLSLSRISDYVSKTVINKSYNTQVPVIENRTSGFYPFAFLNEKGSEESIINDVLKQGIQQIDKTEVTLRDFSTDIRVSIQKECINRNNLILDNIELDNYKVIEYDDFDFDRLNGIEKLKQNIIMYSINKNIESIRDLLEKKTVKNQNKNNTMYNLLVGLSKQNVPDYTEVYSINLIDEYIECKFKVFKSENIKKVSFATGYVVYQSKWGVVSLWITFLIDWDGEEDLNIKNIDIKSRGFVLEEETLNMVKGLDDNIINKILKLKEDWDIKRNAEINAFRNISQITN
jgi:hypothetical protein